jgi:uncharacterized protein YxeA
MKKVIIIFLMVLICSSCGTVNKAKIMRQRGNYFILAEKEKANKYPAYLDWSKKDQK